MDDKVKTFIFWMDDPKCPFEHCFNGVDKDRPRIEYVKGNKHYSLDEVWGYWIKEIEK